MNVFPHTIGQTFTVKKGPTWVTTVKQAASGRQVRSSLQAAPIWKFKVAYEFIRDRTPAASDLQALWAFFNVAQGQLMPWLFLDPYDNVVTTQAFAVGDGASTAFQLGRTVGASTAFPFLEPIYAVNGSYTVYVNGTPTTVTLAANGVVQFSSPPANGAILSWTGSFYFLCHFTQDDLSPQQMVKDLWSQDGLEFESLIP